MLRVPEFSTNAMACYKKLEFKRIGAQRQAYFLNGEYHDEIYMDILPEDFKNRKRG